MAAQGNDDDRSSQDAGVESETVLVEVKKVEGAESDDCGSMWSGECETRVRECFEAASAPPERVLIHSPSDLNVPVTQASLMDIFTTEEWDLEYSFNWEDFRKLYFMTKGVARTDSMNVGIPSTLPFEDEEEVHGGSEIAALVDRIAAQQWPHVRPSDLSSQRDAEDAEDVLKYARQMETTELQSYHEAKWQ